MVARENRTVKGIGWSILSRRNGVLEEPPPSLVAYGVRFALRDMGNGVTRLESHDLLTPDAACACFGTPGFVCVPFPMPPLVRYSIEDAVDAVGQSWPRDWDVRARVRAISDNATEVVAYLNPMAGVEGFEPPERHP